MEIVIKGVSSIEALTKSNKIKFKLYTKSSWIRSGYYFFIGVTILIDSFFERDFQEIIRDIGILFLFYSFNVLATIFKLKKYVNSSVDQYIHRIKSLEYECYINEQFIKITDEESEEKIKWAKFSSYYVNQGYIFLIKDQNILSSFAIHMSKLSDGEYQWFVTFLKSKLPNEK
jgi:hypothetical protein